MNTPYLSEFLTLALLHLTVLVGPGANFTVVVKNSLTLPKRFGFLTAFGVALGTVAHVSLVLFGLSFLLALTKSVVLFSALKLLGASYLIYVGVRSCRAKPKPSNDSNAVYEVTMRKGEAVSIGFFSQLSNPKAILFFISLFTQVVSFPTPLAVKFGYGLWMITATFAWFSLIVYLLSFVGVQHRLRDYLHHISVAFGFLLIFLGTLLAYSVVTH